MHDERLDVENLHLWRGDRHVLRGVSFSLSCGECLQVTGPNGSGKTSLLRTLSALMHPEEGRVLWRGRDVRADLAWYDEVLGGDLVWHFEAFGADVAAVRVGPEDAPLVVLADHRPVPSCLPIWAVRSRHSRCSRYPPPPSRSSSPACSGPAASRTASF